MAYAQISNIIPQFENYANWWLKAYQQGTTTPLVMATDSTGATTASKFEINTNGFPVTSGSALVIPYINAAYDLWLFPTEAEADANDTGAAIQVADNINPEPWTGISEFTAVPTFGGNEFYYSGNINEAVVNVNSQTGTTYTASLSDRNGVITLDNAAAITATIPSNSSVAYPVGTTLSFCQLGAGQVTLSPAVGVTLDTPTGTKINSQYGWASALKIDTNRWILSGSLVV